MQTCLIHRIHKSFLIKNIFHYKNCTSSNKDQSKFSMFRNMFCITKTSMCCIQSRNLTNNSTFLLSVRNSKDICSSLLYLFTNFNHKSHIDFKMDHSRIYIKGGTFLILETVHLSHIQDSLINYKKHIRCLLCKGLDCNLNKN